MTTHHRSRGFSLIELLIVVAVIGILTMVAAPQYQKYVLKGQRSDAFNAISDVSQALESYYTDNNHYTISMNSITTSLSIVSSFTSRSPDKFYSVSITTTGAGNARQTFTVTASAINTQTDDTECTKFSFSETGAKSATGSNSATCW